MKSTKINAQWEEVEGLSGLYVRKASSKNNTQDLDQTKLQKIATRKAELEQKIKDIKARRLSF